MDQTLYVGDVYEEKGATVPDGWVLRISGTVDTSTAGVYEITYYAFNQETGQNATRVKTVEVLAKPVGSITLNGDPVVSLVLGLENAYADAGATSTDGTVFVTNLDGTSSESFTGLPSVAGSYTLIYYVAGAFSNFVTRTVHVLDPNSGGGGGGGGGVSAPTTGPKSVVIEDISTTPTPTTGPKSVGLEISVPTTGPKTVVTKTIPAQGLPIIGISAGGVSLNKPAQSFPIIGTITNAPVSNTPAQSFPIIGTITNAPVSTTPAQSFPIIGTITDV